MSHRITAYTVYEGVETEVMIDRLPTCRDDYSALFHCQTPNGTEFNTEGRYLFPTLPVLRQAVAFVEAVNTAVEAGKPLGEPEVALWFARNPVGGFVSQ